MPWDSNLDFMPGQTFYGNANLPVSTTDGGGISKLGTEVTIKDIRGRYTGTGQRITLRCVRNTANTVLYPNLLVYYSLSGMLTYSGNECNSHSFQGDRVYAGVVDPLLPAAGVAINDIFWIVVEGPVLMYSSYADMVADVAIGDPVASVTAATSQAASTAMGRFTSFLYAATTNTAKAMLNFIGRAMTARTTTGTNTLTLIHLRRVF